MGPTFGGDQPTAAPQCHLDIPPDFQVVRTSSGLWCEDVDALLATPALRSVDADVRRELHAMLDAAVYRARAAGAVVMAWRLTYDKKWGIRVASLLVTMLDTRPYPAGIEAVHLMLEEMPAHAQEDFDTDAGPAVMCTELISTDNEGLDEIGLAQAWQARAYLPVRDTTWTLVAQCQVTGRQLRSRDLAQSVAARMAHTFRMDDPTADESQLSSRIPHP